MIFELRQDQAEAVQRMRANFVEGVMRQVLAAATGAGKSIMGMSMIETAMAKGKRVCFCCDRRVLVDQFSAHLDRHKIDHGVLMSKHWRFQPHKRCQVASIQTLERMDAIPAFDLLVLDEVHAMMRESVIRMLGQRPDMAVIGLSATPFHDLLPSNFGAFVNVVTMAELVNRGVLVPFKVYAATEIDMEGVPISKGEWQEKETERRALKVIGDVVVDYMRLSRDVFGGPRKTICFSAGVAHGAELVRAFAAQGLNFAQISYRDDDTFKAEVLEDFRKPDTALHGIISADILTRGFDQTDVMHVIDAAPLRRAFSKHVQKLGRGARSHPGKEFCIIQDHAGNWARFKDDFDVLFNEGVEPLIQAGVEKKVRKEASKEEKEASKCPRCGYYWGKADTCPGCGFKRVLRSMIETVPGVMQLDDGSKSAGLRLAEQRQFYRELLGVCAKRGWDKKMAYHRYFEKYKERPPGDFYSLSAVSPSITTERWVKHRMIAWAKSKLKGERTSK